MKEVLDKQVTQRCGAQLGSLSLVPYEVPLGPHLTSSASLVKHRSAVGFVSDLNAPCRHCRYFRGSSGDTKPQYP